MKVYLSGPMRGYPAYNFPAFDAVARRLRATGHEVASPADHDRDGGFDPNRTEHAQDFDLTAALLWDFAQVLAADAVVVMPGWQLALGALAEVAVARAGGVPVVELAALEWGRASLIPANIGTAVEASLR